MDKYCVNCGKEISQEAEFCKYCGAAQSAKAADSRPDRKTVASVSSIISNNTRKQKKKKVDVAKLLIATLVAVGVIAACIAGVIWIRYKLEDENLIKEKQAAELTGKETEEIDKTGESIREEEKDKTDKSKEKDKEDTDKDEALKYKVGGTYKVKADPNLLVRKGPGKDQEILKRGDLKGDDYKQSVGTTDDEDAALDKGSRVVCLEMSGNWMRIESGWICVEDKGEVLVE